MTFATPSGAGENPVLPETLRQFIATALQNNPALAEAENHIKVLKQVPPQAGSLDDPILRFELMNMPVDTFDFGQEPMTQKKITVSQNFPFPGKLGLRSDITFKDVSVAENDLDELKLQIAREVKQAYFELAFILASTEITEKNKSLLEQFVTIAASKYTVGKGIQQDVLKAQVELSKLLDELIRLEKLKQSEQARLNSLMDRLPQSPLSISPQMSKLPFHRDIETLQTMAETHRPILNKLKVLIDKYGLSRQLAEREYYPNFNVGFGYGQREDGPLVDRPDFFSAFVGINIPLWHDTKQSKKVAEESYKVEVVRETYRKVKNDVYLRIKQILDQEAEVAQLITLIKTGIIPQAEQSLEVALADYQVGRVDFLTLLDNQITLFKWEIKYHRELSDYNKAIAELENMVGTELTQ